MMLGLLREQQLRLCCHGQQQCQQLSAVWATGVVHFIRRLCRSTSLHGATVSDSYRSLCHLPYNHFISCVRAEWNPYSKRYYLSVGIPTNPHPPMCENGTPKSFVIASVLSAVQIFIIVISVLLAVGIITCVLSHYKMGARSWSDQRNRQQPSSRQLQSCPQQQQYTYSLTPTTASMMYTPATLQDRQRLEAAAHQDHLVRLHSVQTDLALNLPHSIALPDGEEGPRCDVKMLKLQDPEQHAEITRSFIRPPPNRTVSENHCLPPFRSNSVGLLQKSPSSHPPTVLVARCHSVSNAQSGKLGYARGQCTPTNPAPPCIWVPSSVAMNSRMSGNSGTTNRTYGCTQAVTNSKYDSSDPPPPYSEVVKQMDVKPVNRQQNSGV